VLSSLKYSLPVTTATLPLKSTFFGGAQLECELMKSTTSSGSSSTSGSSSSSSSSSSSRRHSPLARGQNMQTPDHAVHAHGFLNSLKLSCHIYLGCGGLTLLN
jgi:hypothetical protein